MSGKIFFNKQPDDAFSIKGGENLKAYMNDGLQ
jgi:hypothetical protein